LLDKVVVSQTWILSSKWLAQELLQKYLCDRQILTRELFWVVEEHTLPIVFIDGIGAKR
jgi:ATP-dependent 26S proteasome regulatory subunit